MSRSFFEHPRRTGGVETLVSIVPSEFLAPPAGTLIDSRRLQSRLCSDGVITIQRRRYRSKKFIPKHAKSQFHILSLLLASVRSALEQNSILLQIVSF